MERERQDAPDNPLPKDSEEWQPRCLYVGARKALGWKEQKEESQGRAGERKLPRAILVFQKHGSLLYGGKGRITLGG